MVSRYSFPEKKKAPEPEKQLVTIGGNYSCQFCREVVQTAEWAPDTGDLGWRCSKGHLSVIKDFHI